MKDPVTIRVIGAGAQIETDTAMAELLIHRVRKTKRPPRQEHRGSRRVRSVVPAPGWGNLISNISCKIKNPRPLAAAFFPHSSTLSSSSYVTRRFRPTQVFSYTLKPLSSVDEGKRKPTWFKSSFNVRILILWRGGSPPEEGLVATSS